MVGLALSTAQIVDSIERAIHESVDGTIWSAPKAGVAIGHGLGPALLCRGMRQAYEGSGAQAILGYEKTSL